MNTNTMVYYRGVWKGSRNDIYAGRLCPPAISRHQQRVAAVVESTQYVHEDWHLYDWKEWLCN